MRTGKGADARLVVADDLDLGQDRTRTPLAIRKMERDKVPITLLTGYLGAGKSTLLE